MRQGFFIFCFAFLFALSMVLSPLIGFWFAMSTFFLVAGCTFSFFFVSVPEITGLITINVFTGVLQHYEQGMSFRFPWEQVKERNYIDLRVIQSGELTETCPSFDGPAMLVRWSFRYCPVPKQLPQYIAVSKETINKGLEDIGSSFLSAKIAKMEAMEAKADQAIIQTELRDAFDAASSIVHKFGIKIIDIALADVDYEQRFQQARATEQISVRLRDVATKIVIEAAAKGEKITMEEAMNMALIMNKDVTKDIQEAKGGDFATLMSLVRNMGAGGKKGEQKGDKK